MTTGALYVDVSCVRIQSYLSRTTKLRARRGASAAIAAATKAAIKDLTDARPHTEAGEADGVIHLVADVPDGPPKRVDEVTGELVQQVFRQLRSRLPAAEFQGVWGIGNGYLDAHHQQIGPRLRRGDVLSNLGPLPEVGYGRRCGLCHHDPAVAPRDLDGEGDSEPTSTLLCVDCDMRMGDVTRTYASTAERELAKYLGDKTPVEHLTELAALGAPDSDGNHVGTVFIDGNAFGDFFDQLATRGAELPADTKAHISRDLNAHTRTALAEAASAVNQPKIDGNKLWVIPHLVGGDDVLVSLPADRAWAFTCHYLRVFGDLVEQTRAEALKNVSELPALSASAGLVFSHHTEPFNLVVPEADRRLKEAKSLVSGKAASVAAVDLTSGDGEVRALRLVHLEQYQSQLTDLRKLPRAARQTLTAMLRRPTPDLKAVHNQVKRLNLHAVEPFLADGSSIDLARALALVRWWR